MSSQTPDLFGFKPAQGDLFADEPARNDGVGVANPEAVRARLLKLLAEARAAEFRPPWNERTTRTIQIVFRKWRTGFRTTKPSNCASRSRRKCDA